MQYGRFRETLDAAIQAHSQEISSPQIYPATNTKLKFGLARK